MTAAKGPWNIIAAVALTVVVLLLATLIFVLWFFLRWKKQRWYNSQNQAATLVDPILFSPYTLSLDTTSASGALSHFTMALGDEVQLDAPPPYDEAESDR